MPINGLALRKKLPGVVKNVIIQDNQRAGILVDHLSGILRMRRVAHWLEKEKQC
jgi:hypothetical protein